MLLATKKSRRGPTQSFFHDPHDAELLECRAKLAAVDRTQAVIEFKLDGTILTANDNFLMTVGYELDEIVGRHHQIFVDPIEADSREYAEFWKTFARNEFHSGEFQRVRKDGNAVWISAAYVPIVDELGVPYKVVKYATDITEQVALRQRTQEVGEGVSSSIEQIVETISEISNHVNTTAGLASSTQHDTAATAEAVKELDSSSAAISQILDMIRELAGQTNLLALNATIEAARAGEAGRGFSVVANEVKQLAKETSQATDAIDESISRIRGLIETSVEATSHVTTGIDKVTESMTSIASAVEEQSATMQDLSRTASLLR